MRTRLAAGEKPYRKRMAALACVYDAEPGTAPAARRDRPARRAQRRTRDTARPARRAKWLAGSVAHDAGEVIAAAFGQHHSGGVDDVLGRDPLAAHDASDRPMSW